jgi:hypothetical protein
MNTQLELGGVSMTFEEWRTQYSALKNRADRVSNMITERAREACKQAGLCGDLLGIHPHNAMCSYEAGKPWPEVDYHYCRLSLHLQEKSYEPYRILEQWHQKAWERVIKH